MTEVPSRSNEEASDRSQQSLHHLDISGHPELFVCGARGAEKLAGFFAISGCVSLQKHTRVPALPSIYSSARVAIELLGRGGHYAFMLRSLLGSFISSFKTRRSLAFENLALRQQLAVRKRCVKRSRLTELDRGFWVLLRRVWTDWDNVLVIVKPETVVRWHRAGFRRYWTWKSRKRRPGRPGVAFEVRELIRGMCRANPLWGAPRVHGELTSSASPFPRPRCPCT